MLDHLILIGLLVLQYLVKLAFHVSIFLLGR
jgi:hypothetical protein